jgi:hypothetical protein
MLNNNFRAVPPPQHPSHYSLVAFTSSFETHDLVEIDTMLFAIYLSLLTEVTGASASTSRNGRGILPAQELERAFRMESKRGNERHIKVC